MSKGQISRTCRALKPWWWEEAARWWNAFCQVAKMPSSSGKKLRQEETSDSLKEMNLQYAYINDNNQITTWWCCRRFWSPVQTAQLSHPQPASCISFHRWGNALNQHWRQHDMFDGQTAALLRASKKKLQDQNLVFTEASRTAVGVETFC